MNVSSFDAGALGNIDDADRAWLANLAERYGPSVAEAARRGLEQRERVAPARPRPSRALTAALARERCDVLRENADVILHARRVGAANRIADPVVVVTDLPQVTASLPRGAAASAARRGDWHVFAVGRQPWLDALRRLTPGRRYAALEKRVITRVTVVVHAAGKTPAIHQPSLDELRRWCSATG